MQGKIVIEFDTHTHAAKIEAGPLTGLQVALIISQIIPTYLQQALAVNSLMLPFDPKVGVGGFGK